MELKINDEEISLLRSILSQMAIQDHSSVLGFMHGLDRFVSLNLPLKKKQKDALNLLANKIGLAAGIKNVKKS